MIVVLAVLALAGALVLARGPQRSATLDLRQAASTVAGSLRVARGRAIAANRPVSVLLDANTARVQVAGTPPRSLPAGVGMAVTLPAGRNGVVFMPDGSATGGQVVLSTRGRAARVSVDWLSGRVSIADANG